MGYVKEVLRLHAEWKGKLDANPKMEINTKDDLSLAYTSGAAVPCLEIEKGINKSYELTGRGNLVAVVTDGTAVLGLGDTGPEVGMPVMEGKCALFKEFSNVNTIPLCARSKDVDEIVYIIALLSGNFGGINLEDITVPHCLEIKVKLRKLCGVPIFHNDRYGIAIIAAAASLSTAELIGKDMGDLRIVINGVGSTGIATTRLLLNMKFGDVTPRDSKDNVYKGREDVNAGRKEITELMNEGMLKGNLADTMKGSNISTGVPAPDVVNEAMVANIDEKSIVLPMANPIPEIMSDKAKHAGAFIVGAGHSDFTNQINNALAFPGTFRGTLDVRTSDINEEMGVAVAYVTASLVSGEELSIGYIIPSALDKEVGAIIAEAVVQAAKEGSVARI